VREDGEGLEMETSSASLLLQSASSSCLCSSLLRSRSKTHSATLEQLDEHSWSPHRLCHAMHQFESEEQEMHEHTTTIAMAATRLKKGEMSLTTHGPNI